MKSVISSELLLYWATGFLHEMLYMIPNTYANLMHLSVFLSIVFINLSLLSTGARNLPPPASQEKAVSSFLPRLFIPI